MNEYSKEIFANNVIERLSNFGMDQKLQIKEAIMEEISNYVVYSPEEAAEVIKEPLMILDHFLKTKKGEGMAGSTIKLYRFTITHFIGHTVKKVVEITSDDIRDYLNKKALNGMAAASINNIRSSLSSFFSWLFNEEYIARNPMCKVNKIKHQRELQPAFSEIEVDLLRREANSSYRDIAIIDFLLSTGCRVSEMCSVNISDVNFNAKKLRVVGKGNKPRIVYLTDVAISTLRRYLKSRTDDNEALFVSERKPNKRVSVRGVQDILRKLGKRCHIENVHPHRFRHTCCTRLLCRGMKIQDVARILGHANVNTTMWYNNTTDEHIDIEFRQYSF